MAISAFRSPEKCTTRDQDFGTATTIFTDDSINFVLGESKQSVISIVCSKAGEYSAAKAVQSGQVQYSIWGNGTLYRWYQGEQNWYQGRVSFMTGDLLQRIPTYETILSLKQDQILSAEYVALNQRTCIYVESAESSINTRIHYWIDAEQGSVVARRGASRRPDDLVHRSV